MDTRSAIRHPQSESACVAHTRTGAPCRARPLPGRAFCHFHDPERAARLSASRRKGGAAPRRRYRRQITAAEVTHLLGEFLLHALRDPMAVDTGRLERLRALAQVWFQANSRPQSSSTVDPARSAPHRPQPASRLASALEAALQDCFLAAPEPSASPPPAASPASTALSLGPVAALTPLPLPRELAPEQAENRTCTRPPAAGDSLRQIASMQRPPTPSCACPELAPPQALNTTCTRPPATTKH